MGSRSDSTVIGMNEGIKTVIYPVKDVEKAKGRFRTLMGEPAYELPKVVGWKIEDQDFVLDGSARHRGLAGPVCYWHVDDVHSSLQALLDAGAELVEPVQDIGGGGLRAIVKDPEGNAMGLRETAR